MVAALTPLPVIGMPVKGNGIDSLYSIVQIPVSLKQNIIFVIINYYFLNTLFFMITISFIARSSHSNSCD
jgi:hypothetical protein